MKFDVLTLFPEMFETLTKSITGKAIEKELININLINIYDDKGDFKLINKKLLEYSKKFKINYIDLNKLDKSYFTYFDDKVYINSKGMYKINEILAKNS